MFSRYTSIWRGVLALFFLPAQVSFAANLPTAEQVEGILTLCAGGVTKEVQTALQGKIEIWKRAAQVKGSADLSTLGAILRSVPEGQQVNEKNYSTYVDCTLKQTSKFLNQESAPLTTLEMVGELSVVEGGKDTLTTHFDQKYQIDNFKSAASDMAKAFTSYLQKADKGEVYKATLAVQDHALRIESDADQTATLHVTRFNGVRTLSDLDKIIYAATRSIEQVSRDDIIARSAGEGPLIDPENRDWKLREGVYRIAVVAPLYEPAVHYVQLTDKGLLEIGMERERKPIPDQWHVELRKRSKEKAVRIAVASFGVTAVTQPDKRFDSQGQVLQQTFIDELNRTDHFYAFQSTKTSVITYDPGRAKGQNPLYPDADIADFKVTAYSILAPSEMPVDRAH